MNDDRPGLFRSYGRACGILSVALLCWLVIIVVVAWVIGRVT